MTNKEQAERARHRFICILKEIVSGEIDAEISANYDETLLYLAEIRDAIEPLNKRIEALEMELSEYKETSQNCYTRLNYGKKGNVGHEKWTNNGKLSVL